MREASLIPLVALSPSQPPSQLHGLFSVRINAHFSPQLHNRFPHDGGQGRESIGGPRERWSAGCRRGDSAASKHFSNTDPVSVYQ